MADFDLLVVGAGAAGLMGALRAAQGGARVCLLERDAAQRSNLMISGGLFAAAGTRFQAALGVEDEPALFSADIRRKTGDGVPPDLLRLVTCRSAEVPVFLADEVGLPILLSTTARFPGHSVLRLHATPAESGAELSTLLRDAARQHPRIAWLDGAEAIGLVVEGGCVTGVRLASGETPRAAWSLLACGGFGGNAALLAEYVPAAAGARHVGSSASDGRGVLWARSLGASLACMDAYQGQPHICSESTQAHRLGAALPALGAIMVDRKGRRFTDERAGPSELTAHVLAQIGGAVEIWDADAQAAALRQGPFRAATEAGMVVACANVLALAARFSLPADALAQTLAEAGQRPPFFAAAVTGGIAHTQGGVILDDCARVLRADGAPIPGLLAAGGVACGLSGYGAAGYVPGNGLAQSFTLGLIAGETASTLSH
ncbi:FAD-binding protein [Roseomonas sp. CAU 1739]|uniref:FAD-dependent oxidoreductase n=1 Tax=Roseomonas sp. CAU 1739 TaxID=3140364 RepID=UPI00325AEDDA